MCEQIWRQRARSVPSVARVQIHSTEDVQRILRAQQPVIITNFQSFWPSATHASGSNDSPFSKANLAKRFGSNMVRVSVSESDRFDGPEDASLWGLATSRSGGSESSRGGHTYEEVLVRPPQTSMLLADFLTLVSGQSARPQHLAELQETFYMEYLALHQYLGQVRSSMRGLCVLCVSVFPSVCLSI